MYPDSSIVLKSIANSVATAATLPTPTPLNNLITPSGALSLTLGLDLDDCNQTHQKSHLLAEEKQFAPLVFRQLRVKAVLRPVDSLPPSPTIV
ncbi:hypothetical protein JTE90_020380 [Oedothorax gibbosus]|uniref:Uncharacterized protein n=1 Tax=Oedothorax gibbosus TaxID=931172 RepID=A0AAV6UEP0_9ARAC|nr:hypothetical protein JTE90_020380 [Oedothorax gibbosus]